jgi:predicted nucleic-acid-binding Zn-ribbon protein
MRESHVCPKCRFNRVLWIAQVPEAGSRVDGSANIARTVLRGVGFLGGDTYAFSSAGDLSACVCRRCGYTELYTTNVEAIPIDGRLVSELVGPEPSDAPYR